MLPFPTPQSLIPEVIIIQLTEIVTSLIEFV